MRFRATGNFKSAVLLGVTILGAVFAFVLALAGRSLSRRKHYWFAFVVACIECIFVPFGTILGVFTIIVLSRQSVKTLFSILVEGD